MQITIRRGLLEDVPTVAGMWAKIVIGEDKNATPNEDLYIKQSERLVKIPNYYLYLAEVNGEIVGFNDGIVSVDPSNSQKYVAGRHFYVTPEHRKTGVAQALHKNSQDVARELGATVIRRYIRPDKVQFLLSKGHVIKEYVVDEYIQEVTT